MAVVMQPASAEYFCIRCWLPTEMVTNCSYCWHIQIINEWEDQLLVIGRKLIHTRKQARATDATAAEDLANREAANASPDPRVA